jgi:hypothetical protein
MVPCCEIEDLWDAKCYQVKSGCERPEGGGPG